MLAVVLPKARTVQAQLKASIPLVRALFGHHSPIKEVDNGKIGDEVYGCDGLRRITVSGLDTFSPVLDSSHRCPRKLRSIFLGEQMVRTAAGPPPDALRSS